MYAQLLYVKFNQQAANLNNAVVLCISADLPFAQARFCGAEGIENVETLSTFRHKEVHDNLGVNITTGPIAGLTARSVIVLDETITCYIVNWCLKLKMSQIMKLR